MPSADLHLHSRYSDRPSEWLLRKVGVPQSYSDPAALYQKLHAAGMTYKTITDHNRIEGCLEIAHFPDVFISEEVTTYFPDGCKIHLLVWNITEEQHRDIQALRPNIYELAGYLRDNNIAHAVAHALVSLNQLLTIEHFEKLILLFKIFEGRNSNREPLAQTTAMLCLQALTSQHVEEMANRHDLAPTHAEPHNKILTGGSDDHGGLYVARTYTEVARTASSQGVHHGSAVAIREFFEALQRGEAGAIGPMGDPLSLSSSIYVTAFTYAEDKLKRTAPTSGGLMAKMAERFIAGQNPTAFSLTERIGHIAEALRTGKAFDFVKPGESTLAREIGSYFSNPEVKAALDKLIAAEPNAQRRSFRMASHLTNELSYKLWSQFLTRLHKGNLLDALQSISGLLPVGCAVLPYVMAFHQHAPDRKLLAAAARRMTGRLPSVLQNEKRAWFTDTLEDVNGVARTIRAMTLAAKKAGADLTVVTSRSEISIHDIPIRNFPPVGEFEIPEYELQKLSFPPFLEMLDYLERGKFTEIIISTPGPIGMCAFASAKLLGLKVTGIYHTDFPQYARFLSDDAFVETITWGYMHWFYGQCDSVFVNSEFYRRCWIDRGIAPEKLRIFPRGLDTSNFSPRHYDAAFWTRRNAAARAAAGGSPPAPTLPQPPVLLYVGRVSKEKDLAFLAEVLIALKDKGRRFTMAVVGDGPYRQELQTLLPDAIFTGVLTGKELGAAYASADLFVFPSTTDTFGNVVVEAMASGLPVAVSNIGGPRELVTTEREGRVLPARNVEAWVRGLEEMLATLPTRAAREVLAQKVHDERSWDRAFTTFWEG
ncbi:histidinol-phosphatase [Verrucomicrobia bacterium LW23]|nr:histidinol-phosphatase [Verrucomicrobia bacterium LW23]